MIPVTSDNDGLGKRERTAERIYRAAVRLFTERGFEQTTVQDIAAAANVGKGTFFNYFPTKDAVLVHFLEQRGIETMQLGEQRLGPGETAQDRIRTMLDRLAQNLSADEALSRLTLDASLRSHMMAGANRATGDHFRSAFARVFQAGQASGEFAQEPPAERLAEYLVAVFYRVVRDRLERGEDFDLGERLREVLDLIVEGLRPRRD
jgi:AcrR family transcriptional regulator